MKVTQSWMGSVAGNGFWEIQCDVLQLFAINPGAPTLEGHLTSPVLNKGLML